MPQIMFVPAPSDAKCRHWYWSNLGVARLEARGVRRMKIRVHTQSIFAEGVPICSICVHLSVEPSFWIAENLLRRQKRRVALGKGI